MAYWINAYNACVLKGVIARYPLKSVRDVKPPFGFFLRFRYVLGGKPMTLYTLENRVIRKRYGDPRVHFVLNCASQSCPRLPQKSLNGTTLSRDLDQLTVGFLSEPRNLNIAGQAIRLSSIFKFYKSDFVQWVRVHQGMAKGGLREFIRMYIPPEKARALDQKPISFLPYDWRLNDQPE
ncbi:MAG: DUF547 domain-containing protein [Elusimicrobia bacterium]|nr:DUF547 domain-containing protein [Elusimicrobiota bacterium]